jgi:hypothetical protein
VPTVPEDQVSGVRLNAIAGADFYTQLVQSPDHGEQEEQYPIFIAL